MKTITSALIGFLLFIPVLLPAQTYSFKYRIAADSIYTSAQSVIQANPMGRYALGLWRERMYSNFYYEGYAKSDMVYYKWDLTGVNMTDTTRFEDNDPAQYNPGLGYKKSSIITFKYDKEISFLVDKKNEVQYYLVNDSVEGTFILNDWTFSKTKETKMIGKWSCIKWVPNDPSLKDRVSIWVSQAIPPEINLGIFFKPFKGGIARIEWSNGRYDELMEYVTLNTPYAFKHIEPKGQPTKGMDILRAPMGDNFSDSFYEEEKFGNLE